VLTPAGNESAPSLPGNDAATDVPQILQDKPSSTSPALQDQPYREPPLNGVFAEKTDRDAALLEVFRTFESRSVPFVQSDSEPEAPEGTCTFGWQHYAALGLLSLGVLALRQPRSRKRTAPNLKTAKS
jgi:hypothetical protein